MNTLVSGTSLLIRSVPVVGAAAAAGGGVAGTGAGAAGSVFGGGGGLGDGRGSGGRTATGSATGRESPDIIHHTPIPAASIRAPAATITVNRLCTVCPSPHGMMPHADAATLPHCFHPGSCRRAHGHGTTGGRRAV